MDQHEDVSGLLLSSLTVSEVHDASTNKQRSELYKMKSGASADQQERRRLALEEQKSKRQDSFAALRDVEDDEWNTYYYDYGEQQQDPNWDYKDSRNMSMMGHHDGKNWAYRLRNRVMSNEWMLEAPDDLEAMWLFFLFPKGTRLLVVANYSCTSAYNKKGERSFRFKSMLPGGRQNEHCTVLDCVCDQDSKTMYVIDILTWNGHPVVDAEAEFRNFWLLSKLSETPEVGEVSKKNKFKFLPIQFLPCSKQALETSLATDPGFPMDGVCFLHKESHYTIGAINPLALWAQPYMLRELLGVTVPAKFAPPAKYTGIEAHAEDVKRKAVELEARRQTWLDRIKAQNEAAAKRHAELGRRWTRQSWSGGYGSYGGYGDYPNYDYSTFSYDAANTDPAEFSDYTGGYNDTASSVAAAAYPANAFTPVELAGDDQRPPHPDRPNPFDFGRDAQYAGGYASSAGISAFARATNSLFAFSK